MKNIFILSSVVDSSADEIIHWLYSFTECNIIRILKHDKIEIVDITMSPDLKSTFSIIVNDTVRIKSEDIDGYYCRRGEFAYQHILQKEYGNNFFNAFYNSINRYYAHEWSDIQEFVHYLLRSSTIKCLNSFFDARVNKLTSLEVAKRNGINIPDTIVTNSLERIRYFLKKHKQVIVKPVKAPGDFYVLGEDVIHYSQSTNLFTENHLNEFVNKHTTFQPTQFQEYIEKEFEIRAFYLKGKFYSMAIFSQANEKTKIDFRNYDETIPNRNVPFKLPKDIELKIEKLMNHFDYDTGSIDLIYNKGDYFFLEVNTGGMFEWVSKNCNYYIEKEIANFIVK